MSGQIRRISPALIAAATLARADSIPNLSVFGTSRILEMFSPW